jgi:hypothetical protein
MSSEKIQMEQWNLKHMSIKSVFFNCLGFFCVYCNYTEDVYLFTSLQHFHWDFSKNGFHLGVRLFRLFWPSLQFINVPTRSQQSHQSVTGTWQTLYRQRSGDFSGCPTSTLQLLTEREQTWHIYFPWHQEQLLLKSPGPCITGWVWIIYTIFKPRLKSHSPNQPKYLNKVSSHLKQQLLLKRFKNWNEYYWCIRLVFSIN